jgi:uncharacterized membrane protein
MVNQAENVVGMRGDERGGIAVRDYTQGGLPSGLRRFKFNVDMFARALVWVSLGLGLAEVLAPKRVQKLVGIKRGNHSTLIRLAGVREIGHALLLLIQSRPLTGIWSRIAGDAMDLGLLGAAYTMPRVQKNRVSAATVSIVGITALDALTAAQLTRKRNKVESISDLIQSDINGKADGRGFHVMRSITINSSPNEVYQFWRNFENLPQFMYHLQEVRLIDERRWHWVSNAPAGTQVDWDAEITEDRPNELIAWRSMANADVPNSGEVRFETGTGGRGTVVRVEIEYRIPGGRIGRIVAKMFGDEPGQQVKGDLGRLKQVIETGEVTRSDSVPEGLGDKSLRPAQPLAQEEVEKIRSEMI